MHSKSKTDLHGLGPTELQIRFNRKVKAAAKWWRKAVICSLLEILMIVGGITDDPKDDSDNIAGNCYIGLA